MDLFYLKCIFIIDISSNLNPTHYNVRYNMIKKYENYIHNIIYKYNEIIKTCNRIQDIYRAILYY